MHTGKQVVPYMQICQKSKYADELDVLTSNLKLNIRVQQTISFLEKKNTVSIVLSICLAVHSNIVSDIVDILSRFDRQDISEVRCIPVFFTWLFNDTVTIETQS
jgi:hypothetical protein